MILDDVYTLRLSPAEVLALRLALLALEAEVRAGERDPVVLAPIAQIRAKLRDVLVHRG